MAMATLFKSIHLIAGRSGQEFNQRKSRSGAFRDNCYHITAQNRGTFSRYCACIDLSIVHAGVAEHPSQRLFSCYKELQQPRRKNILIDYQKLLEMLDTDNSGHARQDHKWDRLLSF